MKDRPDNNNPFDYENAFSLILSLQEQISVSTNGNGINTVETLTNKFERLSKLTIGELEFARRMGFDQIPCIRISPYPILWKDYNQPSSMDFTILMNGLRYCVDVKYYDPKHLRQKLLIPKSTRDSIKKFRDFHHFDGGLIAIKRYEKWYLFDVSDYDRRARNSGISFKELEEINMLDEKHIVFNTGASKKHTNYYDIPNDISTVGGVYVKKIQIEDELVKIPISTKSKVSDQDICEFHGVHAKLHARLYALLEQNMNFLCEEFDNFKDCDSFTDALPTAFTLADSIKEIRSESDLKQKFLNACLKMNILFYENGDKLKFYFHRLYDILTYQKRKHNKKKYLEIAD